MLAWQEKKRQCHFSLRCEHHFLFSIDEDFCAFSPFFCFWKQKEFLNGKAKGISGRKVKKTSRSSLEEMEKGAEGVGKEQPGQLTP